MELGDRSARRAQRAAETRRRRRVVGVILVILAAAAGGVIALATGGDETPQPASSPPRADHSRAARTAPAAAPAPGTRLPGAHRAPAEAVPVLMYHVVNDPPEGTANPELWVSPHDLTAEVAALSAAGYHGVTLQRVYDAWHEDGLLPSKPIVLSFDDGYTSHRSKAMPILRAAGWPGVLNLQVDQTREDLKAPDVRALIRAGWEVDAHTFTHPDLTTLDGPALEHEIAGSRAELRRTFGVPVNFFCYPAGSYDATVIAAVRAAGYLGATTTELGLASPKDNPFALRRIRVNRSDGVDGMLEHLRSAEAGQTGPAQAEAPA